MLDGPIPAKTRKPFLPRTQQFYMPKDFHDRTFFDAFADAFTQPDDLILHQMDCDFMARIHNTHRIREYFQKALSAEKERENNAAAE